MITTPGHGVFPSGHATQVHAVACVLKLLMQPDSTRPPPPSTEIDQLDRQSARITTNRVVAGVHFPVDSMAGRMLGVTLGEYFVARCTSTTAAPRRFMSRTFNAGIIDGAPTTEFNPFHVDQNLDLPASAGKLYSAVQAPNNLPPSPLLAYVWDKARAEWSIRFP